MTIKHTTFDHNQDTIIHENKTFSEINYSGQTLRNREFIHCEFIRCNFNKSDLRGNIFESCVFTQCNLSMTNIHAASLRTIAFKDCKMLGIDFSSCNSFGFSVSFSECILDYAICTGVNLRKTVFTGCSLKEAEFTNTNLSEAAFISCDLTGARFARTNLEKADFRTAHHFTVNPDNNRIKAARFSAFNLKGLLEQYDINIDE